MNISGKKGLFFLLGGDIVLLVVSLWLALVLRYHGFPPQDFFLIHLIPFTFLFALWIVTFYSAGLYDRLAFDYARRLPGLLLRVQTINAVTAIIFFYLISASIAPKTILFIYLIVSSALILAWRLYGFLWIHAPKKIQTVLIGGGDIVKEVEGEILQAPRYGLSISKMYNLDTGAAPDIAEIKDLVREKGVSLIVSDLKDPRVADLMNHLYELIFDGVTFSRLDKVYESFFFRIPLSHIGHGWFLENIYSRHRASYEFLKRLMDIVISLPLLILSAPFFPLVSLCIKLESPGRAFIIQERIGKGGKRIYIPKFRSMTVDDKGVWLTSNDNRLTHTGRFIRASRIDELPQLWSVIKGDLSLIGPRPDLVQFYEKLVEDIPYYAARNLVAPGLSGWAQISQEKPPQSVEETKIRLSYDLYYVKNRSIFMDIEIALKTLRILLSRLGM